MMQPNAHYLLRIYTDEAALDGDRRVFEIVMERARAERMLGATVLRGRIGFGGGGQMHEGGFLNHNYPLVIEIVDEEDRVRGLVGHLADLHGIGLMTLEKVEVIRGGRALAA
jgi:PII-like signaling protein